MTNKGKPQVDIRQAITSKSVALEAVEKLTKMQKHFLSKGIGGSQTELKALIEVGRD